MKFLILTKPRIGAPPLQNPLATYQAAKAYYDAAMAKGQLDCVWQRVTGGGVTIANANSAEELFEGLHTYPLYGLFEWQVEPLVDFAYAFNEIVERLQKTSV
jgi:hypothetical protein